MQFTHQWKFTKLARGQGLCQVLRGGEGAKTTSLRVFQRRHALRVFLPPSAICLLESSSEPRDPGWRPWDLTWGQQLLNHKVVRAPEAPGAVATHSRKMYSAHMSGALVTTLGSRPCSPRKGTLMPPHVFSFFGHLLNICSISSTSHIILLWPCNLQMRKVRVRGAYTLLDEE